MVVVKDRLVHELNDNSATLEFLVQDSEKLNGVDDKGKHQNLFAIEPGGMINSCFGKTISKSMLSVNDVLIEELTVDYEVFQEILIDNTVNVKVSEGDFVVLENVIKEPVGTTSLVIVVVNFGSHHSGERILDDCSVPLNDVFADMMSLVGKDGVIIVSNSVCEEREGYVYVVWNVLFNSFYIDPGAHSSVNSVKVKENFDKEATSCEDSVDLFSAFKGSNDMLVTCVDHVVNQSTVGESRLLLSGFKGETTNLKVNSDCRNHLVITSTCVKRENDKSCFGFHC
ncbi:OLC1v1025156C1 [Oldenlandia corymbosa var. corymbosa]|uniref:OLC1v1025156C1 n=1 Tax=Oldenlandia corymbosa var. corymbosa TaxID=529605 RepID=A0AAV1C5H2_OLDCO|nr:OLC1v1025156C1 [Oldenlandia corymbosa var. corymbosa]